MDDFIGACYTSKITENDIDEFVKLSDINAVDENNENIMHHYIHNADIDFNIIFAMIERGINTQAVNKYGDTPIDLLKKELAKWTNESYENFTEDYTDHVDILTTLIELVGVCQ